MRWRRSRMPVYITSGAPPGLRAARAVRASTLSKTELSTPSGITWMRLLAMPHAAQRRERELQVEHRLLPGRPDHDPAPQPEVGDAMHVHAFRRLALPEVVRDDVQLVPARGQRLRHLADAARRAVVRGERARH